MIQFKRGTTKSWRNTKVKLASGQPGYDKDKHKLKVGDGKTSWAELPYVSGLSANEILDSEEAAKTRSTKDAEDNTLITYGTEAPDKDTIGHVYLQQYDAEPETDYVVKSGISGIWTYQKWKSGIAKCFGVFSIETKVNAAIEGSSLFHNDTAIESINYPFAFKKTPAEITTIQSPGGIVWLANRTKNTEAKSGVYMIISTDEQIANANYSISIQAEGLWK